MLPCKHPIAQSQAMRNYSRIPWDAHAYLLFGPGTKQVNKFYFVRKKKAISNQIIQANDISCWVVGL